MVAAVGLEIVNDRAGREAILADPSVSRRLVGTPVNINNPNNIWLREADGVAVFGKQGRDDYCLLAPTLEAVTPHNLRLLAHIFLDTEGMQVWFDSESEAGAEFGALPAGSWSKLTRNERGRVRPVMFRMWRLPVAAWLQKRDEIRVAGGRIRRVLTKNGASLGNIKDQDECDRRLGFLALTVRTGQYLKGISDGINTPVCAVCKRSG